MSTPEIENRSKQDIFREIQKTAASYVPQWQCDPDNPDPGTTLALVYSEMHEDTINHLRKVLDKNRIAFAQELGTENRPASPAHGIVSFGLSTGDFGGVCVPKGYQVSGGTDKNGNRLVYETCDDVFVTPAKPAAMICTDTVNDRILNWKREDHPASFTLFDPEAESLQKHTFSIDTGDLGPVKGEACIRIAFEPYRYAEEKSDPSWLAKEAVFSYSSEQGLTEFERQEFSDGHLVLYKGKEQPDFPNDSVNSGIVCNYPDKYLRKTLKVSSLKISAQNLHCDPELIQTTEGPQPADRFYPFGEKPALYNELYLANEEVLSKKGAKVNLSFILGMEEHPFSLVEEETVKEWKIFMKNSSFTAAKRYDVAITQVVWEYFNGRGWSRLFADASYEDIFDLDDQTVYHRADVSFICPDDCEPIELFSKKSRYIRARITRMSNLYKIRGRYFTPVIQNPVFSYLYENEGISSAKVSSENNLKTRGFKPDSGNDNNCMVLLEGLGQSKNAIYLCFDRPFESGPVRMYIEMAKKTGIMMPPLSCSCYTADGFQEIRLMDESNYFAKSGMISLVNNRKAVKAEKFGFTGYWYRLEDVKSGYSELILQGALPVIRALYINSVKVTAVTESGCEGNQPADSITSMSKSIGYLSFVTNHMGFSGGIDRETDEQAISRSFARLRHHDRALTASDFEALTLEAVRDAHQVKCFSGRDESGNAVNGHVTIVVLHDDFDGVKESIFNYLKSRTSAGLVMRNALHVTEPHYVPISCHVEITIGNYNSLYSVHKEVTERLEQFLDPVTGNSDQKGFRVGTIPDEMQIYHLLQDIEGIRSLDKVRVSSSLGDIRRITDPYVIPVNGTHSVEIGVKYADEY